MPIEAVARIAQSGETVINYADDKPYPSRLVLGYDGDWPIHVLVAEDAKEGTLIVVTAYQPSLDIWLPGWTQRRRP